MAKGRVGRIPKGDGTGQSKAPRLKGNSSTTNVGKGTGKGGAKGADTTDKNLFKRGDARGGKGANFLTDKAKFKRGDGRLTGQKSDLTYPIQKPLSRGD